MGREIIPLFVFFKVKPRSYILKGFTIENLTAISEFAVS